MLRIETSGAGIGERNCEFIEQFLWTERIPVVAHRLRGTQPLQVSFHTHTGEAHVRALGEDFIGDLAQEELRFRLTVSQAGAKALSEDITLF